MPRLRTLEELKQRWPSYQSQDGHLLYARALEKVGRDDEALREYEELSRYFAGQEVQVRRLLLLDRMGHKIKAHQIANEVLRYFKRCPSYARKQQSEWFSAARGLPQVGRREAVLRGQSRLGGGESPIGTVGAPSWSSALGRCPAKSEM